MKTRIDRRDFLKLSGAAGAGLGLASVGMPSLRAAEYANGAPVAEKLGWRVACCAYTFNQFTFYEALERTASLGLKLVEGFSWQPVSKEKKDVQTNEAMPAAVCEEVKKRLADTGMKLAGCYMAQMPNQEDVCRKKFEWAKKLGIEYFVTEPPLEAMDLVARLCDEYEICVAIHNHPKPSSVYWNPETVVKATKGRTKRLGDCCRHGPLGPLRARPGRVPQEARRPADQLPPEGHHRGRQGRCPRRPLGRGQGERRRRPPGSLPAEGQAASSASSTSSTARPGRTWPSASRSSTRSPPS